MKKFLEKSGITIISLIVTIIVLLILAGIGISAIVGDNSVINKSQNVKLKAEESQAEEELSTAWINIISDNYYSLEEITKEIFNSYLKSSTGEVKNLSINEDKNIAIKYKIKDTGNEYDFLLNLDGKIVDNSND